MKTSNAHLDIRVQRTNRLLFTTLHNLLQRHAFREIMVRQICAEANISRAAFYLHFYDKYDLLKHYLADVRRDIASERYAFGGTEGKMIRFIHENAKGIAGVMKDADGEVLALVRDFIHALLLDGNGADGTPGVSHDVTDHFIVSGVMGHIAWLIDEKFAPETDCATASLYRMIRSLLRRQYRSNAV